MIRDLIEWVPIEAAIDLHDELLEEHGGAPGLRDRGALESVLARPRQIQADQPDFELCALAAAYARGILQNHPFIDGNKRAAFVTMGVFLQLNGLYLDATERDAELVMVRISSGNLTDDQLAAWLRETCAQLDSRD